VNNPHFLIMQGRITKVINMKPAEILGMLEETAGTKMYETKEKKTAAIRKTYEHVSRDFGNIFSTLMDLSLDAHGLVPERFPSRMDVLLLLARMEPRLPRRAWKGIVDFYPDRADMVTSPQFMEAMGPFAAVETQGEVFKSWYRFITYQQYPGFLTSNWIIAQNKAHVPLLSSFVLDAFDQWLELVDFTDEKHPDCFRKDVNKLVAFFDKYCYQPSLMLATEEPYGHNDDMEHVFFCFGRLRHAPDALLVLGFALNCWV
jgi:hypothetical protein